MIPEKRCPTCNQLLHTPWWLWLVGIAAFGLPSIVVWEAARWIFSHVAWVP